MPVADTIRYLSYNDFYGQFALGREHFLELPEEIRKRALQRLLLLRDPVPERRARA